MQRSAPMPPSARLFAGALGVLFVGLAAVILSTSPDLSWQPVVVALAVLVVGLDLLLGAVRGRWPRLAPALLLP